MFSPVVWSPSRFDSLHCTFRYRIIFWWIWETKLNFDIRWFEKPNGARAWSNWWWHFTWKHSWISRYHFTWSWPIHSHHASILLSLLQYKITTVCKCCTIDNRSSSFKSTPLNEKSRNFIRQRGNDKSDVLIDSPYAITYSVECVNTFVSGMNSTFGKFCAYACHIYNSRSKQVVPINLGLTTPVGIFLYNLAMIQSPSIIIASITTAIERYKSTKAKLKRQHVQSV